MDPTSTPAEPNENQSANQTTQPPVNMDEQNFNDDKFEEVDDVDSTSQPQPAVISSTPEPKKSNKLVVVVLSIVVVLLVGLFIFVLVQG